MTEANAGSPAATRATPSPQIAAISSNCPNGGAYVTPGASDCAACGYVLARTEDSPGSRRAPLLSGLLVLSTFGTVIALLVVFSQLFLSTSPGTALQVVDGIISLVLLGVSLGALWGIWKWRKWAAYLYFDLAAVIIALALAFGNISWRLVISAAFTLLLLYLVRAQWSQFK